MKIKWIGHSCFSVEEGGYKIVIDPYEDGTVPGLGPVAEEADEVVCSHEHFDHNARGNVKIKASGAPGMSVETIPWYHDANKGTERGSNNIIIIKGKDARVVHMGDTGCMIDDEVLAGINKEPVDVLLLPVGGYYTVDAKVAKEIADAIDAKLTIPMHYRDGDMGFDVISTVDKFTALYSNVKEISESEIEVGKDSGILVMKPANRA